MSVHGHWLCWFHILLHLRGWFVIVWHNWNLSEHTLHFFVDVLCLSEDILVKLKHTELKQRQRKNKGSRVLSTNAHTKKRVCTHNSSGIFLILFPASLSWLSSPTMSVNQLITHRCVKWNPTIRDVPRCASQKIPWGPTELFTNTVLHIIIEVDIDYRQIYDEKFI